ncbi:Uncharacterised protein [Fusobacterium necrophorum subsp. necrophorum]|uniref:Uncharacterized protein n=1 Tax=Fusobacterium necrophorum BL TaxID=1441732 RepID=A0AB73BT04_9FUSO|nr:hypothetical protein FUSO3_12310 [Fusobacterium necrophorum BL]SQD10439.1 Uncharacterised protein [Fusobacterium necrophorum subsp. necrophorum]
MNNKEEIMIVNQASLVNKICMIRGDLSCKIKCHTKIK